MTVTHNAPLGRYEMETEHGLAVAVYVQQGDRLVFTHTEVPAADEGKGIGSHSLRPQTESWSGLPTFFANTPCLSNWDFRRTKLPHPISPNVPIWRDLSRTLI